MLKREVLGVVSATLLAGASVAHGAIRRGVNQTVTLATLSQTAGYAKPGSSAVYAGTVRSKLGRGAIVLTIRIVSHPSATTFKFRGTGTTFYSHGTTRSAFTGTGTLRPVGRFMLAGHGDYTGGSLHRYARGKYSFTGTAPAPPPIPPPPPIRPCAVPAGWKVVASDAHVVVILDQPDYSIQEYRYCNYATPSRGFQLLVRNDLSHFLGGSATYSTVDGVALGHIMYHSTSVVDSPGCPGPNRGTSTVYGVDATSGNTTVLAQGSGGITSAQLSPSGVGAWILTLDGCPWVGDNQRTETLKSFSFRTGTLTTLDTGDPGETITSPPSLGNLELYQCAEGCPAATAIVAWTHDGTWRYEQVG